MAAETVIGGRDSRTNSDLLVELLKRNEDSSLWVDHTGRGCAVADMLKEMKIPFNTLRLVDSNALRQLRRDEECENRNNQKPSE